MVRLLEIEGSSQFECPRDHSEQTKKTVEKLTQKTTTCIAETGLVMVTLCDSILRDA
jgi:hypothetical protein